MSSADTDLSSFSIHELAMMHDALDQEVASLTGAINLPRTTNAVSDWLESRMHAAWACMDTIISEARARGRRMRRRGATDLCCSQFARSATSRRLAIWRSLRRRWPLRAHHERYPSLPIPCWRRC